MAWIHRPPPGVVALHLPLQSVGQADLVLGGERGVPLLEPLVGGQQRRLGGVVASDPYSASGSGMTPVSTARRSSAGLASQVAW
jgi:hypothetical protein